MSDIHDQLRTWSQSLADSVAPTHVDAVRSSTTASGASFTTASGTSHPGRRWLAVAASMVFVVAGIVAIAILGDDGPGRISPATEVPGTTDDTTTSTSTAPDPAPTTAPTPIAPPPTTPTPDSVVPPDASSGTSSVTSSRDVTTNGDEFDMVAVFGDVGADALAVTGDGRVIAAAGARLLVRDPDGAVETIGLPDGIVVSQASVGTDEIAVVWGTDRGVEVDLRTGSVVTSLTRTGDTWTRTDPSPADSYTVDESRPFDPLGLGLLVDAGTQLPTVEGAGGFETLSDETQSWTVSRPGDFSALVDEIAPRTAGGYIMTMRSQVADPPGAAGVYLYVLHADGTIDDLGAVDNGEQAADVQVVPDGLTLLFVDAATATIEHIPVPDTT